MSHAELLLQDKPLDDPAHLDLVRERLRFQENAHKTRIHNVQLERRLVLGDVWKSQANEDERRITDAVGHDLVGMGASILLPKPPIISVMPYSQDFGAQQEADAMTRWIYAALDNLQAQTVFNAWAKEVMFGVGFLHMLPDRFAMPDEVPIILDIPDSCGVLYNIGPKHTVDYCFLRHEMTVRDLQRTLGRYDELGSRRETEQREIWCYYAEERFINPLTGRPDRRILYGVLERGGDWAYPLADITRIMERIPVFPAFNADGYYWRGNEAARARGIQTPIQEKILFASDFLSNLANGTLRAINPSIGVTQDPNAEPLDLDLRPSGRTDLQPGEKIEPITAGDPGAQTYGFFQQFKTGIGESTFPQMFTPTRDLEGVHGAAYGEQMHPAMVKNDIRQGNLQIGMRAFLRLMLRHTAAVIDPEEGLELFGTDPRNKQQVREIARPQDLLKHHRVDVKLTQQTPRNVFLYVQTLLALGNAGYLPRQLVTEQSAELMNLPVRDMSSVMDQIASDDEYKMRLDVLKAKAQEAMGFLREREHNQEEQPALQPNGEAPYRMSSMAVDPVMQAQAQPPMLPAPAAPPY